MNNEIIVKMKSLYPELTKSEKKVALYIHDHYEQVLYMSIGDLASECSVGETTILRFCKRLGYSGFYEFKQKMILQVKKKKDGQNVHINKTFEFIEVMLKETEQLINEEDILQAAKLIVNSQTIFLVGSGFSGLTAMATETRLASMGYRAIAARDNYIKILYSNMMTSQELVIGFSISGENLSTIKFLKMAKKNGAHTIAITNHEESSLARVADVVLLTTGKELGKQGSTLITEMSQYIVLEVLFEKLHDIDEDNIKKMNEKIFDYIKGDK
ncbi:MAG: MurR/RpiR family transcriptional regulator [Longibaculum sp.]